MIYPACKAGAKKGGGGGEGEGGREEAGKGKGKEVPSIKTRCFCILPTNFLN